MQRAYVLPPASLTKFRDIPVDLLRGIAIALMVGANTIPYLLLPPVPFPVRVLASLAAPLFILLSGMMVALSRTRKQYDLRYFLIRGGLVLLIAAGLEAVVWGIFPFIDMDVLFLIGISLPLAYLFLALDRRVRWGIILVLFCAAPVLQLAFGYPALPVQIPVAGAAGGIVRLSLPLVAGHWFIGGWFPVFPWLGLAFLGAELGSIRWAGAGIRSFATRQFAAVGLGMLATGIALWSLFPGQQLVRYGYVELFYPAVPGFCLVACGAILCMFVIADILPPAYLPDPLRAMGECSLAIYILHSVIIAWCIQPLNLLLPLPQFLLCIIAFIGGMCTFAYLLRCLRPAVGGQSLVVRFLMGG
jgi:uncharacterized membrane protein